MSNESPIHLAYPYVPEEARQAVFQTLGTRWIGQGPQVDAFEKAWEERWHSKPAVAVGSGTDSLHLSYILAGVEQDDEVITPVFTCTATNFPILWLKARPVFADISPSTLNIDPADVARKITSRTKAIVAVDYAGQPCDYDALLAISKDTGIPLIDDAAHAVGAEYHGRPIGSIADYTCFSFQAIKHITTGDGGMLCTDNAERAKLIRWFGLDRKKKLEDVRRWEGDIWEVGYKYQMTDIAASMGLASLQKIDEQLALRAALVSRYRDGLKDIKGIALLENTPQTVSGNWLMTILAEDRENLIDFLTDHSIESSPLHYRNDQYTVFQEFRSAVPGMDQVGHKILCLPLHMFLTSADVDRVVNVIADFYARPLSTIPKAAHTTSVSA